MLQTSDCSERTLAVRHVRVIASPLGCMALVGWGGFLRALHFARDTIQPASTVSPSDCQSGDHRLGFRTAGGNSNPAGISRFERAGFEQPLDGYTAEHPSVAPGLVPDSDRGPWEWESCEPVLLEAERELGAYFAGELREFRVPIQLAGTPFQQRVWGQLRSIPYGETCSYGALAARIGSPSASRAVGAALGKNPLGILVPCHRVIGSTGKLVGFAGGIDVKRQLLELERSGLAE